jgi:hypothetical protein
MERLLPPCKHSACAEVLTRNERLDSALEDQYFRGLSSATRTRAREEIVQELGFWPNARQKEVVPSPRARNI